MFVKVRFNGSTHIISVKSKLSKIKELRKEVESKTGIPPARQRLFFKGKQLENAYTFFDYDVKMNSFIEMAERIVFEEPTTSKAKSSSDENEDAADKENVSQNGNHKSSSSSQNSAEEKQSKGEPEKPKKNPEEEENLNENEEADEKNPLTREKSNEEKIKEIYDGDIKDLIPDEPEQICKKCKNKADKDCKECGCNVCGKKDDDAATMICDECEYYHHYYCVGLESVPDGDWFCDNCKNDADEIVQPGANLKLRKSKANMPSSKSTCKRDWGSGMATSGRNKSCTKVPDNHFGPIPGIEVGMSWRFRITVSEEGVHRPPVAGIAGRPAEGAFSIVLAGGYEGDIDNGDEFVYTGAGGRDLSGNKRTSAQSFDQELTKTNLAIAVNCYGKIDKEKGHDAGENWRKGKPVRVIRTYKLQEKGRKNPYAPKEGCRYDGIYKVVKYWPEKGNSGFLLWRYLLRRDDESPAPWTKEGKEIIENNGFVCIWPEGVKEMQEAKEKEKALKLLSGKTGGKKGKGQKRGKEKEDEEKDEEEEDEAGPPDAKKAKGNNDKKNKTSPKKVSPVATTAQSIKKFAKYNIDKKVLAMMDEEELNKVEWEDIKTKHYDTKLDFTNDIETRFTCLICQYIIHQPLTTKCNHNLCQECFKNFLKHSETKQCPNCRTDLTDDKGILNEKLSEILEKIFPGYGNDR